MRENREDGAGILARYAYEQPEIALTSLECVMLEDVCVCVCVLSYVCSLRDSVSCPKKTVCIYNVRNGVCVCVFVTQLLDSA